MSILKVIHLENNEVEINDQLSVALGYFDGLHRGHQAVINEAVTYAKQNGIKSAVLTFSPNPNVVLKKLTSELLLTPYQEKVRLLTEMGVDYLFILAFNEVTASIKASEFIQTYLIDLNVRHVSTGFDFRFGQRGEGSVELLRTYQDEFTLNVTEKCGIEDEKIGATQIKSYLAVGDVKKAAEMLGRPYLLTGTVITGQQKGRQIGFPTANLGLTEAFVVPKNGVYAVKVWVDEGSYIGMCNVGHNPTFNFIDQVSIEVNILDFNQDIYGKEMKIEFYERLRDEQRFSSIQELMAQLDSDRETVRRYFK